MLVDYDIEREILKGTLGVTPFTPAHLGPASLDLTLDRYFRRPTVQVRHLDMAEVVPDHTVPYDAHEDEHGTYVWIMPGEFLLGTTVERVCLGPEMAARVEGRSSIGRIGLLVHTTAGFIDPGFEGQITLEFANLSPWAIKMRPGMRICQLAFYRTSRTARTPYGVKGHYQDQIGPVESRLRR